MKQDITLNLLEQRPHWGKLTANYAWIYAFPADIDGTAIARNLECAFETVCTSFPCLAGNLMNKGADAATGNTGIYKIVPRRGEKLSDIARQSVVVEDLRHVALAPDMEAFRRAEFDMNLLDEDVFAPRPSFTPTPELVSPRGDVSVAVCLRAEDAVRLCGDGVFMRHARRIGGRMAGTRL